MWSRARQLCPCPAHPPSLVPASPQPGACTPQPGACPPTHLLRGCWMKVSSWAVSRIRWGPRISCSYRILHLEVSKAQDREDGAVVTPPSGSSELPLIQSPPGPPCLPACLPHQSLLG